MRGCNPRATPDERGARARCAGGDPAHRRRAAAVAPDWAVAVAAAVLLVLIGVVSLTGARHALRDLGPTVGFLAALLLLADGCQRAGLFDALGTGIAQRAGGHPLRLFALVFLTASVTTAVLTTAAGSITCHARCCSCGPGSHRVSTASGGPRTCGSRAAASGSAALEHPAPLVVGDDQVEQPKWCDHETY